jgi:peptidoglycan LD-endopeptidase LytH
VTAASLAILETTLRASALLPDPVPALRKAVGRWHADTPLTEAAIDALSKSVAIDGMHPSLLGYSLRAACGYEPVPGSARVAAWLRANARAIGPLVPLDLQTAPLVYTDWSVTAPQFVGPEQYDDAAGFTARIWADMRTAGAHAAIGGYDHVRPAYGGALFRAATEMRTVHLGFDVFMDAGTPVCAPLDGRVHSAADNAAKFDYGPCVVLAHRVSPEVPAFHTLYGHLDRASLQRLRPGMQVRRGDLLGRMGPFPENGDWPPHVHLQLILDMLDRRGDFNGSCRPSQRDVWLSLCPDANLIARVPAALLPDVREQQRCGAETAFVRESRGARFDACGQRVA